jgi:hypothetical protein
MRRGLMTILLLQNACIGWSPETTIKTACPGRFIRGAKPKSQTSKELKIRNMKKNLAEFRGTFLLFIVIPIAGAMLAGFVYKYLKL